MTLTNFVERYSGNDTSGLSRGNLFFALLILLTRLPFLTNGFGTDEDSWGLALTAFNIHNTLSYEVSRFPGFPVHELVSSVFIVGGAVALNLMTAVMSSVAVLFFVCALQEMRFKFPYLAGVVFAFAPVVFIHSTDTIDYMWAMAFIMLSFWMILSGQTIVSALALSVATGCRITSLAMLMPFSVLLIDKNLSTRKNAIAILRYCIIALMFSVVIYLPVIIKYGKAFLTFYDLSGYPTISKVLYKFTLGVWGIAGSVAILFAIGSLLFSSPLSPGKFLLPKTINEKHIIAWLVAIDLTIIIFIRLPYESGYLIPIVPFTIMLFGKYMREKAFIIFSALIIVSPWLIGIATADKPDSPKPSSLASVFNFSTEKITLDLARGPLLTDLTAREATMLFADSVLNEVENLTDTSVIICGWWSTKILYKYAHLPESKKNNLIIISQYLNRDELISYVQKRFNIYYLPMQDSFEKKLYGIDVKYFGALPLLQSEEEEEEGPELQPES